MAIKELWNEGEDADWQEHARALRRIIENVADMIGVTDSSGRLQFHSPSAERLLGYGSDKLAGQRVSDFVHQDDLHRVNEFFEEQATPEAPTRTLDFRIRHGDGSLRWFSVVASPMVQADRAVSIIFNARDVTDRMLLEAQLEQANRLNSLGQLAATVAHEFNNVLMGIQPFADLMKRPGVTPDVIASSARHITNSIIRGKRVALDILRYTNPAKPSLEPIDVGDWWQELAPEALASVGDQIELTVDFTGPLQMLGDSVQLSQVFSNLIGNARDAMPHGGSLHIAARLGRAGETFSFGVVEHPERFVYFVVADTGAGMTEQVLAHIFDPLFTTKKHGGTGLGLAVAHQALKAQGGHIFVESVSGQGTTFHLFIPATEDMDVAPEAGVVPATMSVRILVVDDESAIAEGLAELLKDSGAEVQIAATGEEAIEACKRFRPDLALIDIRLPDISGVEVAQRIRTEDPHVKILFASGHGAADAAPLRNESTGFLQKPFSFEALLEAIAALESTKP
jgi:two-component system cell cycle sensor histidine kinase/response regulator CckA